MLGDGGWDLPRIYHQHHERFWFAKLQRPAHGEFHADYHPSTLRVAAGEVELPARQAASNDLIKVGNVGWGHREGGVRLTGWHLLHEGACLDLSDVHSVPEILEP